MDYSIFVFSTKWTKSAMPSPVLATSYMQAVLPVVGSMIVPKYLHRTKRKFQCRNLKVELMQGQACVTLKQCYRCWKWFATEEKYVVLNTKEVQTPMKIILSKILNLEVLVHSFPGYCLGG